MKLTEAYTKVPAAKQKKFINRLSNELIKQFEQIYSPTRKIRWDLPNTMSAIAEKEGIDYENLSDRSVYAEPKLHRPCRDPAGDCLRPHRFPYPRGVAQEKERYRQVSRQARRDKHPLLHRCWSTGGQHSHADRRSEHHSDAARGRKRSGP